jgi:hypothetical protein
MGSPYRLLLAVPLADVRRRHRLVAARRHPDGPPAAASASGQPLHVGWLYNAAGASVLIAGLFHATFNATINPTGFALGVLNLPPDEAFAVLNAMVILAAVAVAATRGRLGLRAAVLKQKRP